MATLFRFSEAAALALHAMIVVAGRDGGVVSARELARKLAASEAHMVKVCQRLTRAGLLVSHRGARGGFALARPARRIRLLEVYAAIEGPVTLNACLFRDRSCTRPPRHDCTVGERILRLEREFLRYLRSTSLATVAAGNDLAVPA